LVGGEIVITLPNNPIELVIRAAQNLYPDLDVKIWFNPGLNQECGEALALLVTCEDGSIEIYVSTNVPFYAIPEIIAHELAHLVALPDDDHSQRWEEAFNLIAEEYTRISSKLAEDIGGKLCM